MTKFDKRKIRNMWLRIGAALLDKMTAASIAVNSDRSAWAERVLTATVNKGLPELLDTSLLIESLQRDQRVLLRIEISLANKVANKAANLGITLTNFVLFAMIGELHQIKATDGA